MTHATDTVWYIFCDFALLHIYRACTSYIHVHMYLYTRIIASIDVLPPKNQALYEYCTHVIKYLIQKHPECKKRSGQGLKKS